MKRRTRLFRSFVGWCWLLAAAGAAAADWPTYRHDFARSGATPDALRAPLHRQWVFRPRHKPLPAWPEPGRELNRLDFDYAFQPVIAGGLVFFGSSADDKIYALDLATGKERWSVFTEGPVRFAPSVAGGRVFAASDDGCVYALDAATGRLLWRKYLGPRPDRFIGNGRVISRWPLRTGVAVENGVVYAAAGMWPSEGVFVVALRASDGKVLWRNDHTDQMYIRQPHPGAYAMTGVSPQGYLVSDGERIFVPTGRNTPAAYDRRTGKFLYYHSGPASWGCRWGGCWNVVAGDALVGWKTHVGPDIAPLPGEYKPFKTDGLVVFDAATGRMRREVNGPLRAVVSGDTIYTAGANEAAAYPLHAWTRGSAKPKWTARCGRAYELILAGRTLVLAGPGEATALDADTGKTLWKDRVAGEARGLAAADGRLVVSTTDGSLYCYSSRPATPQVVRPKTVADPYAARAAAAEQVRRLLAETKKTEGVCLALGVGDGAWLYQLAKQSRLVVYAVEPDAAKVEQVRRKMDAAGLYGVRVVVQRGDFQHLACPEYFADLIVTGDGRPLDAGTCSARALYRSLHPYGGVMYLETKQDAAAAREWLLAAGVPAQEIATQGRVLRVTRGALPGAADWTHQYATPGRAGASKDQVKLPLKVLWFGKPGPSTLVTRHWGGPAPLCVKGRLFVIGQYVITAVDAYNGRLLWRRDFGKQEVGWHPVKARGSAVAADDDGVYVLLGRQCLRLDPATGETAQTYALPPAPEGVPAAQARGFIWSYLAVGKGRLVGLMGGGGEGRAVFALRKDGSLLWRWKPRGAVGCNALSYDGARVYLIDANPWSEIRRAARRGIPLKRFGSIVALDAETGREAWSAPTRREALWWSDGVLLATSPSGMSGYDAATGKRLYERRVHVGRFPVIANGVIYIEPRAYDLRTGAPHTHRNPFDGAANAWAFRRSHGCGSLSGGCNVLLFRSATLAAYDLAGDSGVYNLGGVRAGCYVNEIAAAGLVLAPPSDAGCTCSYSFRTTVALAPAERPREWSIFYYVLPSTLVKRAALNLGAPGDRRDADRTVWLAAPRPQTPQRRTGLDAPFHFEFAPGFGPYRRSLDWLRVDRTRRPWLYANGLKGVRRITLDVSIPHPGYVAWPASPAPKLDGRLDDACWDGFKAIPLNSEKATVMLRQDAKNLYVAYRRPAPGRPWRMAARKPDAPVWRDDSFELYLAPVPSSSRAPATRCLHLGVSPSGAKYDAAWKYVTPVLPPRGLPPVKVTIDGRGDDWAGQGLLVRGLTGVYRGEAGRLKRANDFDQTFRIGWTPEGLALLVEVKDNVVHEWENPSQLWVGDSVQIFLSPAVGRKPRCQIILTPGRAPEFKGRARVYDYRKDKAGGKLTVRLAAARTPTGYVLEALLPWSDVGVEPKDGATFAMQILANDDDMKGARSRFRVQWHPNGDPQRDPNAYQTFRLAAKPGEPIDFRSKARRWRWGMLVASPPYPIPVRLPSLGARGEDAAASPKWSCATSVDAKEFRAEVAIPWRTLEQFGHRGAAWMLNAAGRGPLRNAPKLGGSYRRLVRVPESWAKPRRFTLRLHFAEIDGARPGERVFDVKVQGRTVLKDFDVVRAAGGPNRAVIKDIPDVTASEAITLEFVPKAKRLTDRTAPIVCALEILPD